ncbi:MAG: DNA-binding domain-containing protein [Sulfitobacter sp.]
MTDQATFHAGLLDPAAPVPTGLIDGSSQPAGKRYAVYRNNVTVSLIDAMKTAFPLVAKLIGEGNFSQLARVFVRQHPPSSPLMMFYGVEFPQFLEDFQPLSHIGYLPDAARFDLAMRASYHAADIPAFDPCGFQTLPPDALLAATITLAPASIILRSAWPLFDIWAYNQNPDAGKPRNGPQDILITRQEFDPAPHLLPAGAAPWLEALAQGASFGAAHDAALTATPDFDLTAGLGLALATSALATLNHKDLI